MSDDHRRRRLESVIPEMIKRAVEIGVEKASGAPDNLKEFVGGLKLPREVASYLFAQIDETKNGLFRVVGKEVRDFLDHANLGAEMQKMLTTVQFEINTTIRFKPNEGPANGSEAKQAADGENDGDGEGDGQGEADGPPGDGERRTPMPKPEVKADVRVKRYGDRRRRNRE
jgi:hypothetical protein